MGKGDGCVVRGVEEDWVVGEGVGKVARVWCEGLVRVIEIYPGMMSINN